MEEMNNPLQISTLTTRVTEAQLRPLLIKLIEEANPGHYVKSLEFDVRPVVGGGLYRSWEFEGVVVDLTKTPPAPPAPPVIPQPSSRTTWYGLGY